MSGNTENDENDPDTGPNSLQNKPELTTAETSGGKTTIEGKLNSRPNRTFVIRFFSNPGGTSTRGHEVHRTEVGNHQRERHRLLRISTGSGGPSQPDRNRDGHQLGRQHLGVLGAEARSIAERYGESGNPR
jgi:hypothetical protein